MQPIEKEDHFEQYIQFGIDPSIDNQEDNIKRKLKNLNTRFKPFNSKISLKEYGWKTKILIRAPTIDILHYILVFCIAVCEEARSIYMNNALARGEKLQRLENVIIPPTSIESKSKRRRSVSRSDNTSKSPKRRKERSHSKHRDEKSEKRRKSHSRNRSKERSHHSHSRDSRHGTPSIKHEREHEKKRK